MGTRGDITGNLEEEELVLHRFGGEEETLRIDAAKTPSGHSGGDFCMLHDMFEARDQGRAALTNLRQSLESHYMALAAEQSRRSGGKRILLEEFVNENGSIRNMVE